MFNPLCNSTIYQLFKKNFCNQSSHYEKLRMFFVTNGNHHVPTTNSTIFGVSKDEWDKKEDTDKSNKSALHVHGKRHLSG